MNELLIPGSASSSSTDVCGADGWPEKAADDSFLMSPTPPIPSSVHVLSTLVVVAVLLNDSLEYREEAPGDAKDTRQRRGGEKGDEDRSEEEEEEGEYRREFKMRKITPGRFRSSVR